MPERRQKLQKFIDSILEEAKNDAHKILDQLERERDEAIQEMETAISSEAASYEATKISEIASKESRRVNSRMTENKLKLLKYRESCADEVFESATNKINDFVNSSEYPDYMVSLLKEALTAFGSCSSADIYLTEKDMYLKDVLANSANINLSFHAGTFSLGGLRLSCQTLGRRVDASFDSALEGLVGHFSELTGIQVEE